MIKPLLLLFISTAINVIIDNNHCRQHNKKISFIITCLVFISKVLVIASKPGSFPSEQHEVHRQSPSPSLPLHRHLRPPRNAALWREVQLQRRRTETEKQLRLILAVPAHGFPGRKIAYLFSNSSFLIRIFIALFSTAF